MKRIILLVLAMFIGITAYSQNKTIEIPKQDTSLVYIADSLNSIGKDLKIIGEALHKDYNKLGFVGFVRIYKYYILTILLLTALTLLWFRNRFNDEE